MAKEMMLEIKRRSLFLLCIRRVEACKSICFINQKNQHYFATR